MIPPGTLRRGLVLVAVATMAGGATGAHGASRGATSGVCTPRNVTPAYAASVRRAVASRADVWGDRLLAAPGGPTYDSARRFLAPLLLAKGPKGRPLTESGVYYLPFARPAGAAGARSVALHVADGSQIVSRRIGGPSLKVSVGAAGRERYGSCLARLGTPTLADGYLPILETRYVDASGVVYHQESFATRIPQTTALVSLVRVTADTRGTRNGVQLRFEPSLSGLRRDGERLQGEAGTRMLFSPGASFDGASLVYDVAPDRVSTVYAGWLTGTAAVGKPTLDAEAYTSLRRSTAAYWLHYLCRGAQLVVPERRVLDAERSLLVQDLLLTWRYSIGNPYEEFSFPESVDVAEVLGSYGYENAARAVLLTSLTRRPVPYPNWKMGEKLVGSALQYRLFQDGSYIEEATPVLATYVDRLGRQVDGNDRGILSPERSRPTSPTRSSGSTPRPWRGRASGRWAACGRRRATPSSPRGACGSRGGSRRVCVRQFAHRSVVSPTARCSCRRGFSRGSGPTTRSRRRDPAATGTSSFPTRSPRGCFAPGSPEAHGVLAYLDRHGSRLLGLVRAAAFALYGKPVVPTSGTDQVYGTNAARFLADNDQPDRLVLSLYGHLAAGMTKGTFVSGEAASVTPLHGEYERSMYLPPNAASNAAFLETLRLLLVHETRDGRGNPSGLELAYATPRAWLAPGRRIVVRAAPTSFGPVSFSLSAGTQSVRAVVHVPRRSGVPRLGLRLRLPPNERIVRVSVDGRPFMRFDEATHTIDLSGLEGTLRLEAELRSPVN